MVRTLPELTGDASWRLTIINFVLLLIQ